MKKLLSILLTGLILLIALTGCDDANPVSSTTEIQPGTDDPVSDLEISVIDVGQGDCIYIDLPNGETMLIDAGEKENSNSIIDYVKKDGKNALTYVVATHPHADHIGGMADVMNAFDIKNVYMPKASTTTNTFENLLDTIDKKGLTIQTAKAGKVIFDYGNLKAEFIAPNNDTYENLNNYSAVVLITYNEKHFLFMGDAERESESEILASGYKISADILKVGHHGSSSSTTQSFIKAVKPVYALISVGQGNDYGHPTAATLSTLSNANAEIWRTDEKGTVVIICDGKSITIKSLPTPVQANAPPETTESNKAVAETKQQQEETKSETVYITNSGTKYHRDGCKYLSKSKIGVSLDNLGAKYSACSVCNPPKRQ